MPPLNTPLKDIITITSSQQSTIIYVIFVASHVDDPTEIRFFRKNFQERRNAFPGKCAVSSEKFYYCLSITAPAIFLQHQNYFYVYHFNLYSL